MARFLAVIDIPGDPIPHVQDVAIGIDRMFPGREVDSTVYQEANVGSLLLDVIEEPDVCPLSLRELHAIGQQLLDYRDTGRSDDPKEYVIRGEDDGEVVYWSNENGWGGLGDATRFTHRQHREVNLPIGDNVEWTLHAQAYAEEAAAAGYDIDEGVEIMKLAMERNPDLAFTAADMEDH